ncbi:MAG: hypothetical protein HN341_13640 [Verrucomicrobia bacterium]|jgi:hypothetical protein|nr:hypothetical protein [Verrucomicrobiota bacterium]
MMVKIKWLLWVVICQVYWLAVSASGQGCMAVRGSGHCPGLMHADLKPTALASTASVWQVSLGYRWFKSDRHFVGDNERHLPRYRVVENRSSFYDIGLHRTLSDRLSVALTVPFVYSQRRASYEHDNVHRYATHASGLADVRITGYVWLFDPRSRPRGNIRIGAGPKFPTGDYDVQDTFHSPTGRVRRAVDQSIQPGDGGYGFTVEALGVLQLTPSFSGYMQGFYLFNPEEENGVRTDIVTDNPYFRTMSITDQYMARAGIAFKRPPDGGLAAELGLRLEGIPHEDVLGGNEGFRRPGYTVSVEPGINLTYGACEISFSLPVAI